MKVDFTLQVMIVSKLNEKSKITCSFHLFIIYWHYVLLACSNLLKYKFSFTFSLFSLISHILTIFWVLILFLIVYWFTFMRLEFIFLISSFKIIHNLKRILILIQRIEYQYQYLWIDHMLCNAFFVFNKHFLVFFNFYLIVLERFNYDSISTFILYSFHSHLLYSSVFWAEDFKITRGDVEFIMTTESTTYDPYARNDLDGEEPIDGRYLSA